MEVRVFHACEGERSEAEKTKSAKHSFSYRENVLFSCRKWKLVPWWVTFLPACVTFAWKLNRIDRLVIYDDFLWHVVCQCVCTIAMAVRGLFVHQLTLHILACRWMQRQIWLKTARRAAQHSGTWKSRHLFSYSSVSCILSVKTKEKPCRITVYICKAAFSQGSSGHCKTQPCAVCQQIMCKSTKSWACSEDFTV